MFPYDRLRPGGLREDYGDSKVVRGYLEHRLVGCVTFKVKGDAAWFSLLAVAPGSNGLGLGEALISEVDRIANREGAAWLRLDVIDLGKLVSYYEGLGFKEFSRVDYPIGQWNATIPFVVASMERPVGEPQS